MGLDSQKHVTSENQGYIYHLRQNFAGSRHRGVLHHSLESRVFFSSSRCRRKLRIGEALRELEPFLLEAVASGNREPVLPYCSRSPLDGLCGNIFQVKITVLYIHI